jgi:hypothetical protein
MEYSVLVQNLHSTDFIISIRLYYIRTLRYIFLQRNNSIGLIAYLKLLKLDLSAIFVLTSHQLLKQNVNLP